MLLRPTFFAILALGPFVLAQSDSSDSDLTDGLFADFPTQCKDTCSVMEGIISKCSAIGDSESEAESFACVCNDSFVNSLQDCGSCIVPAVGLTSESGNVIAQLAISVGRGCGRPVQIDGVTNSRISSILASPSAATFGSSDGPLSTASPTGTSSSPTSSAASSTSATDSTTSSGATSPATSQTPAAQNDATRHLVGSASAMVLLLMIVLMVSTNRQPIPNTGSLKDRIAKLNLDPTSSPSSSSSPRQSGAGSGPPSPTAQRKTGATTKISDKISRFQANAEETPLLPSGGSFGLAPARPSGFKDGGKGAERGRVASLGAGRAPVPLNVVTPTRSVSTGNIAITPRTASENGSVGSATRGSVGTGGGQDSRPGTPSASRRGSTQDSLTTPAQSDVATSTNDATPSHLDSHLANLLAPGPRTPGAMSVSSMNVETGSIASEGDRNASEADLTPSLGPTDAIDRSDIPDLDQQPPKQSLDLPASSSSIASSDDFPPTPPALPAKGPLDHLRQPSRSASIASMSSLVVEAPPDDVADLSGLSNSGRPTTISEAASEPRTIVTPTPTDDGNEEEEADEKRLERTNEELTRYERDEEDPTAHGPGPENTGDGGLPVRPTWEAEDDTVSMPKAKCSDCDADVDLVELADHSCAPSREPPSLTSPPASPSNRKTVTAEAEPSPIRGSDDAGASETPAPSDHVSSTPTAKLDDYVPQTTSVVPEDIAPEEEEDVLDFYGDEPVSPTTNPDPSRSLNADVPLDLDEETSHDAASSSLSMSRSRSQPTARAPKEHSGPRSHSVYLPGHYDDEEESYEGGTVTIVRSSR